MLLLVLLVSLTIHTIHTYNLYRKHSQSILLSSFDWSYPYYSGYSNTELGCLSKCTLKNECSIVSYNAKLKKCKLLRSKISPGLDDITFDRDNVLYVKRQPNYMENCATFDCNPNARLTCSSNKLCECSGSYNAYVLTTKWCIYCPNQMIFLNGFCFKYNQFSMDWFNANDYCLSLGAELISIINKVDFTFLHNIMSSGPLPRLWVGLKSSNGFDFRWTYDNSIPNTNLKIWSSGCPDGGYPKSPCAYLGYGPEGLLDDGNCGNSFLSYCYKRE